MFYIFHVCMQYDITGTYGTRAINCQEAALQDLRAIQILDNSWSVQTVGDLQPVVLFSKTQFWTSTFFNKQIPDFGWFSSFFFPKIFRHIFHHFPTWQAWWWQAPGQHVEGGPVLRAGLWTHVPPGRAWNLEMEISGGAVSSWWVY